MSTRAGALRRRLRDDEGSAVVEFPLVAVLIIVIALTIIQCALVVHTRNTLTDAAVQAAHTASLEGNSPADGEVRGAQLVHDRFGEDYEVGVEADEDGDGVIRVRVSASFPLVGLLGPAGTMHVDGHAIDEDTW
ncbi:TadE family protein [Brachybacterium subflavum]|uniref:TadE family protein n=1 Tax=Brachybacterium subflavum TaxID=2585206 RepID=UPI00187A3C76|nr:TadE family protein [Brachybacterium subflavum]